jgi:hypothetical protein
VTFGVSDTDLGLPALATLIPISILAGIGILLVFRYTSDAAAVRRAKGVAQAHLLEFRLFMDDPVLVLRAQRDLIVANLRFMKLMLRPFLWMLIPMGLLLAVLEAFYGHAPLPVGGDAIITARVKNADAPLSLRAPAELAVETPPVHVLEDRQVSWRIRPRRAATTELEILQNGQAVTKRISAGTGVHFLSERRGSLLSLLLYPTEAPLSGNEIEWIEIRYPPATVLHLHWLIWFLAISAVTAFALRRRFGAVF